MAEVFLLRVDEQPECATVETRSKKAKPCGETILLVEDYRSLREMIRIGLEKVGYKVVAAGNGVEALDLAKSHKEAIQLLITDVIMPEMDGPQLVEQISEQNSGIKVLFMSGYADEMLGQRSVLNSGVAFIKKPFEICDLLAKIREALQPADATVKPLNSLSA